MALSSVYANYANFVFHLSIANAYSLGNGPMDKLARQRNSAGGRERPQRCWATQITVSQMFLPP